jgi:hypothetical protein
VVKLCPEVIVPELSGPSESPEGLTPVTVNELLLIEPAPEPPPPPGLPEPPWAPPPWRGRVVSPHAVNGAGLAISLRLPRRFLSGAPPFPPPGPASGPAFDAGGQRQADMEGRPPARLGVDGDVSAMGSG